MLKRGTSVFPGLAGDTPLAIRINEIKASLREQNDGNEANLTEDGTNEDDGTDEDELVHNSTSEDDWSSEKLSDDEEDVSEYDGNPKSSAAQMGGKKRSAPAKLPPSKRSRVTLYDPQKRLEEPCQFQPVLEPKPHPGPYTQASEQRQNPQIPPFSPLLQDLQQQEQVHFHPAITPESYPGPSAQDLEQRQEHLQFQPALALKSYSAPYAQVSEQRQSPQIHSFSSLLQNSQQQEHLQLQPVITSEPYQGPYSQGAQQQQENAQSRPIIAPEGAREARIQDWKQEEAPIPQQMQDNMRLHEENLKLKNEIASAEKREAMLMDILRSHDNDSIKTLRMQNLEMGHRLKKQRAAEEGLMDSQKGFPDYCNNEIKQKLYLLLSEIHCAYESLSISDVSLNPSPEDSSGRASRLRQLVKTALGSSYGAWELSQENDRAREDMFRVLITAHIFIDILQSDFPRRYLGLDSAAHTESNIHLFHRDGPKGLLNHDRVILKSLIEKDSFEDLIQTKGQELAHKAAELLTPVLDKASRKMPAHAVVECLAPAYTLALQLKAALALTKNRYTARFFYKGDPIDNEIIEVDGNFDDKGNATRVKVCLFPVVHSKPVPELDDSTMELSKCLVDYKNFEVSGARDRSGEAAVFYKGLVRI